MTLWFFRILVIITGPVLGWFKIGSDWKGILIGVGAALFIIAVEIAIERVPLNHLLFGVIGAGLGLIFAWFVNEAILLVNDPQLSTVTRKYMPLVYVVFTYLGMLISVRRQEEMDRLDRGEVVGKGSRRRGSDIKVVDTSAIIDGRIADVYETKFLSGTLIVGRFILKELQDIADSADGGKRARGRRGLDILQRLQEHQDIQVKVVDKDYPEVKDVDGKLVMLAREFDAQVLTTDFNLNKVASLQGVTVLNVNDLANALKPAVLPGDTMVIFIAKEGKEKEQGVGYLDDGTMVVVEEGRRLVGKKVEAAVTSVLQTSAGRMIFTKLKGNGEGART
ncbi:MAG: hypothetical protein A2992_01620 [Elusimicrobia bacterium RIFCSPLOWO2_01_FULL_59_12]|nr:MAG: hypothetical protein A2992_01620 [Elusimicrobia bacterium RIFCSPLOWO2_01_FULL_59_12]